MLDPEDEAEAKAFLAFVASQADIMEVGGLLD